MAQLADQTISEIVRNDFRTADVFKKYQINFCCSGQVTVAQACEDKDLNLTTVVDDLRDATRKRNIPSGIRFNEWKVGFLIDFIINLHHAFLHTELPVIESRLVAFAESHGKKFPEVFRMLDLFRELSEELTEHTKEEEEKIFPYIRQIDDALRRHETYGALLVKTMRKPLEKNARDHQKIEELLIRLEAQTNHYTTPEKACVSHQVLYHKLRELHDDIVQHTHLESNVLIPKAMAIEKELLEFAG